MTRTRTTTLHVSPRISAGLFLVLLALMSRAVLAKPPIIVGSGDPASCTEDALRDALDQAATNGGGTIRFDCGADPATITLALPPAPPQPPCLPTSLAIPDHTTIDGGGSITIAESPAPASSPCHDHINMFTVGPDVTATITDLALLHTRQSRFPVVTAVSNQGTFSATNVTFTGVGFALANFGTASLKKTTIQQSGDRDGMVGPVVNFGHLSIDDSALINNPLGGIRSFGGTIEIKNSLFQSNSAFFRGGAIASGGDVSVKNSRFIGNSAVREGGAIDNFGTMIIKNSLLSGNHTPVGNPSTGGAVFNGGSLTIENSTLSDNEASGLPNCTLCMAFGGAIYNTGEFGNGTLVIRNSDITSNTATTDGGGIYLAANSPAPALKHVKFANNTPNDIAPIP